MIDAEDAQSRAKKKATSPKKGLVRLPDARLLVVDDGEPNRQFLELVLSRAGAKVETAVHGKEAVEMATQVSYDAILLDMQMPVMDGYTAARQVRDNGLEVPIIALTANAMAGDESKCRDAGCSGFLTKPVDMDKLLCCLAEELELDNTPEAMHGDGGVNPHKSQNSTGQSHGVTSVSGPALASRREPLPAVTVEGMDEAIAKPDELPQSIVTSTLTPSAVDNPKNAGSSNTPADEKPNRGSPLVEPTADLPAQNACGSRSDGTAEGPAQENAVSGSEPPPASQPPRMRPPLVSTLPMDDLEFRAIIEGFITRLQEQMDAMQMAWKAGDTEELARLAHWLKGSGGTMGFGSLSEAAKGLEQLAKQNQREQIGDVLDDLVAQVESIVIPPLETEAQAAAL
jgi:CheY-like chemotaxis protein